LTRENINTQKAPQPQGSYSQAVKAGGFIFVSGQIPIDMATGIITAEGIHKETRVIFDNITAILEEAGSSIEKTVKLTVYLKKIENIKFVNEVMEERFGKNFPARSVVEVSRLPKDIAIEIDAVAEE